MWPPHSGQSWLGRYVSPHSPLNDACWAVHHRGARSRKQPSRQRARRRALPRSEAERPLQLPVGFRQVRRAPRRRSDDTAGVQRQVWTDTPLRRGSAGGGLPPRPQGRWSWPGRSPPPASGSPDRRHRRREGPPPCRRRPDDPHFEPAAQAARHRWSGVGEETKSMQVLEELRQCPDCADAGLSV